MTQSRSIETERLTLRVDRVEDFADMYAMWSEPVVTRYIGGKTSSREDVWGRLLRYAGTWTLFGYGFWVIRDKQSGDFVGEVGFHNLHREIVPPFSDRPELGFGLISSAHGKGFATEAARAALDWGDSAWGERETVRMISPENTPSLRIADKLGYVETARAEYRGTPMILLARRGVRPVPA
jgi:RimJ/RimL family protein N-acetyltransferase